MAKKWDIYLYLAGYRDIVLPKNINKKEMKYDFLSNAELIKTCDAVFTGYFTDKPYLYTIGCSHDQNEYLHYFLTEWLNIPAIDPREVLEKCKGVISKEFDDMISLQ